jgi:hypothetical protein
VLGGVNKMARKKITIEAALSEYFENKREWPWFEFDSDTSIRLDGYLELADLKKIVELMETKK